MRFWFAVLSALMLVISFSAGDAASAAAVPCTQQDVQITEHAEGAAGEPAGCPLSGTPHHHHASCSAQIGVAPAEAAVELAFHAAAVNSARYSASLSVRGPPSLLRPPIA